MQYNYRCPRCWDILIPEDYETEFADATRLLYTQEYYECFGCNAFIKISAIINIEDGL